MYYPHFMTNVFENVDKTRAKTVHERLYSQNKLCCFGIFAS